MHYGVMVWANHTKQPHFLIFLKLKKFFIFIYLVVLHLSCSTWDLYMWPEIKPHLLALGAWSLSHCTTREVPLSFLSPYLQLKNTRPTKLIRDMYIRRLYNWMEFSFILGGQATKYWKLCTHFENCLWIILKYSFIIYISLYIPNLTDIYQAPVFTY